MGVGSTPRIQARWAGPGTAFVVIVNIQGSLNISAQEDCLAARPDTVTFYKRGTRGLGLWSPGTGGTAAPGYTQMGFLSTPQEGALLFMSPSALRESP